MNIKSRLFIVIVFAGLFISVVACQAGADEEVAEIVIVEKTAVYTPTSEPTATKTAVPTATNTPSPTPTTEPTNTPSPTPTSTNTPEPTATIAMDAAWIPEAIPHGRVTLNSAFMDSDAGVTISFDHPRAWQTSYFSDSGFAGWLISDADPNEAFWDALRTGDEMSIVIMPSDKTSIAEFPENSEPVDLVVNEHVEVRYALTDGEIHGNIIHNESDTTFVLFGDYPIENETKVQVGLETILTTFSWEDVDKDVPPNTGWVGVRQEGEIKSGDATIGYAPFASMSTWEFTGTENQEIGLSINSYKPDATLVLAILDESNSLVLLDELTYFTNSITLDSLIMPADGTYTIIVAASTGFFDMGPWSPPSEENSYGWYDISITDAAESATDTTSQPSTTAVPPRVDDTLKPEWLITADDLNSFSDDTDIVEWEAEGEDTLWNTRVCRNHLGWSWSTSQNLAINCILSVTPGATFESVVDSLYEEGVIWAESVTLVPYHQYEDDIIIVGGRLHNGHTYYDLFLMKDDLLYWNSISVGTPPGYTPDMIFEGGGEGIETFLYNLALINIERSSQ